MRAIVTVAARDQVGIIAYVCNILSANDVNILDISQTVLQEYFSMIMLVDTEKCERSFDELRKLLDAAGSEKGMSIRIQREDIFDAMHRI